MLILISSGGHIHAIPMLVSFWWRQCWFFLEAKLNFFLESGDVFFFFLEATRPCFRQCWCTQCNNFFLKNLNTYKKFIEKYFLFFILSQIIFSLNLSIQTNLKEFDFSKSKVFNLAPKLHAQQMCAYMGVDPVIIQSPSHDPFLNWWWPDHTHKFGPGPINKKKLSGLGPVYYISLYSWWACAEWPITITSFSCPQIWRILMGLHSCGFAEEKCSQLGVRRCWIATLTNSLFIFYFLLIFPSQFQPTLWSKLAKRY